MVVLLALGGWHMWGKDINMPIQQAGTVQQNAANNNGKKEIVVYFSYTGNTRILAKQIQKMTGADIFELQPAVPYSKDYDTVVDQGKKEVDEGYKPKLKQQVPNLAQYDVVFVGTPIWWYTISPVTASFLASPELAGKTIIPFCTHGGYGGGHSLEDIKKIAVKSKVSDELVLEGQNSAYDEKTITDWLKKAGWEK